MFLHENIFCDPSLEPSRRGGSNEVSQHMRNKKKISLNYPEYSHLIWSSVSGGTFTEMFNTEILL